MRLCQCACVYQSNGICELETSALLGQPSAGCVCQRNAVINEARLGSPHRYCAPGSVPIHLATSDPLPDTLE